MGRRASIVVRGARYELDGDGLVAMPDDGAPAPPPAAATAATVVRAAARVARAVLELTRRVTFVR